MVTVSTYANNRHPPSVPFFELLRQRRLPTIHPHHPESIELAHRVGIEPTLRGLEALVLPLHQRCINYWQGWFNVFPSLSASSIAHQLFLGTLGWS